MRRPVAVTVFGILHVVFAGVGLLGLLASVVVFFAKPGLPNQNPVLKIMEDSPAYATWVKLSIPLGLINGGVLLAAGIGLLLMKEWARMLSVFYGVYAIALAIANVGVTCIFLVRPMMAAVAGKPGAEVAGAVGAVGAGFGSCLSLVYPILVLVFMTRPNIKAAFRVAANPPVPEPPEVWGR